ncbi:MAG: hypothetical protein WA874_16170 [Chryseosolibacter sp.]
MELLTFPKNEYLLDASLEDLHTQSQEWIKEIDFWTDEITFFYKLLHKKETANVFPARELAEIEKTLIRINGEDMTRLRTEVMAHERLLSSVVRSTSLTDEQSYRESHRKLYREMFRLNELIRVFKRSVFSFYSET